MDDTHTTLFDTVIFDLDGTLIDSTDDIAAAMNKALRAHGGNSVPAEYIGASLGGGPRVLVEQCLAAAHLPATEALVRDVLRDYSAHYKAAPANHTRLLDTAATVLAALNDRGIRVGVCTNKRTALANSVLEALGVRGYIGAVVGSDATILPKPDAQHLMDTVVALEASLEHVLYVGDTEIDRATASNAGATYAHVRWGHDVATVDFRLDSFDDLLAIVRP